MEHKELILLTPEQYKEAKHILAMARFQLLWITIKFFGGLFVANIITILIRNNILVDVEPGTLIAFNVFSVVANAIFMGRYFHLKVTENSDRVNEKLKALVNKP